MPIRTNKWGITAKFLLVPIVSVALLAWAIAFTAFTQSRYDSVARVGVESQTSKARHFAEILDRLSAQHAQYLDLATARLAGASGPTERKGLNALLGALLDLNAEFDSAALDVGRRDADAAKLNAASKELSGLQDVVARLSRERAAEQIRGDVVQSNGHVTRISTTLASLLASAQTHRDAAFRDLEAEVRRSLTILAVVMVLVGTLAIMPTVWARRAVTRPLGAVADAMRQFREDAATPVAIAVESHDEIGEIVAGFNELVASVQQRERALTASTAQLRDGNVALQTEVRDQRSAESQLLRSRELLDAAQAAGGIGVFDLDLDNKVLRGAAAAKADRGWRILQVEDNAVNRRVAEHQLKRLGCTVGSAGNGIEAIAAAATSAWDLVLMDCQMPLLDGFDATREIRRREAGGARLPIIALTANALSGDREACLAAGMDELLSKPLEPATLAACIERWARRAEPATDIVAAAAAAPESAPAHASETSGVAAPPIDMAELHALTDGDTDFQRELIDVFIASGDTTLAALRDALGAGDLAAVRRHAHSLKGASANLRARTLAARALAVENAATAGDLAACHAASNALEQDYRATSEFIGARRAALA